LCRHLQVVIFFVDKKAAGDVYILEINLLLRESSSCVSENAIKSERLVPRVTAVVTTGSSLYIASEEITDVGMIRARNGKQTFTFMESGTDIIMSALLSSDSESVL
jgi:hypothetical protein